MLWVLSFLVLWVPFLAWMLWPSPMARPSSSSAPGAPPAAPARPSWLPTRACRYCAQLVPLSAYRCPSCGAPLQEHA